MLHIAGSLNDIERYGDQIRPGVMVVFNVQDEFEVEGIMEYDADIKMWLGRPVIGGWLPSLTFAFDVRA